MNEQDKPTLTPWGFAPDQQAAFQMLFQKLEELAKDQAEIAKKLEIHTTTESNWQKSMEEKIDSHVQDHAELVGVWRKGAIGGLFMLLGTLITWAGSILWSHK